MLYYFFEYLTQFYSGFDVFRYLTLRIILSALTALSISLIIGPIVIKKLIDKKHCESKNMILHTPTSYDTMLLG